MNRFPICFALLLTACGAEPGPALVAPPPIPADLLQPVPGYTGPPPKTEGQLARALVSTAAALDEANARLAAIAEILSEYPDASD